MKNKNTDYCKETKKYIYSSEAKATRAMNSYEDIQRVYFCSHCEGFHTTSKTIEETLSYGELDLEEENKLLRERINKLTEDFSKVDRLEIVNHNTSTKEKGRLFLNYGKIELSLQDNNKTLKIFI